MNLIPRNKNEHGEKIDNSESGQTLLEFVMLLVIVMLLSFIMIKGLNTAVADKWRAMVYIVSWPTPSVVRFPN